MKYKLNENNNSKKLMIGVSIIFCTVILIIGTSIAYFTQSGSGTTDNIVSVDQVVLEYNDNYEENDDYMRQELIPSSLENVLTAYTREDTNNKCLDSLGYSACSVYKFSVTNISNVSQELMMTLNPTANSYSNLKFIMFEIDENANTQIMETTDLIKDSYEPINLISSYTLNPNNTKTYEIVLYIEAKTYDQTSEDAGKQFGAGIRIDSITTGTYVTKQYGASCWNIEEITEGDNAGTYKLVTFNGIDNTGTAETNENYGKTEESCSGYVEQDDEGFYSVTVPSNVGGKKITTIGNELFMAIDTETLTFNNYNKIKSITIDEGITTIEDGSTEGETGSFLGVGLQNTEDFQYIDVDVSLPQTLMYIGNGAFGVTGITSFIVPCNVEIIGKSSFSASNLSSLIFEDTFEKTSKLKTIGEGAFSGTFLSKLIIPASVETIDFNAFYGNVNLTSLTFKDTIDNPSQLKTIGPRAFEDCNLTYTSSEEPLVIPSSVTTIRYYAFWSSSSGTDEEPKNRYLNYIKFNGTLTAGDTGWYTSVANGGATIEPILTD